MSKTYISLWDSVRRTDRALAKKRVAKLREAFPDATRERLFKLLVRNKCMQAGVIGGLTAITGAIPGVGRIVPLVFGALTDTALTSALQAELVIEILTLYDMEMPEHGERIAILAIAATNLGTDEIARQSSRWITLKAGNLIGARWLRRAWPLANIATSAATNIAVTYAIGNRTQALCQIRGATVSDWPDLFRRVAMIDQNTMMDWAGNAARTAIEQASESARSWSQRIGSFMPNLDFMINTDRAAQAEVAEVAEILDVRKTSRRSAAAKKAAPRAKPRGAGSAAKPAKPKSAPKAAARKSAAKPAAKKAAAKPRAAAKASRAKR